MKNGPLFFLFVVDMAPNDDVVGRSQRRACLLLASLEEHLGVLREDVIQLS